MTKRDRLSFALRRLRNLKVESNLVLRVQGTHQIVKEVIGELSSGARNVDLGDHFIELLEELYLQNAGELKDCSLKTTYPIETQRLSH